jgi:hypothetical protein
MLSAEWRFSATLLGAEFLGRVIRLRARPAPGAAFQSEAPLLADIPVASLPGLKPGAALSLVISRYRELK